jgi:hypothetical protein
MLIAMLDGLRQGERLWHSEPGTPQFARAHRLAIGAQQDVPIAVSPIAEPGERALVGPLDGGGHCLLKELLAQRAGGTGDDEATRPVLDQATPALSFVRLGSCALFFCTNDQNSSISTWLRCRSPASTCLRVSAWDAARLSYTLIVSYLCPVISSAARKLPRRITINRAWATSCVGYLGYPFK